MLSVRIVYCGLAAFFLLAFASLAVVVSGSLWPTRAGMITVGEAVPDFSLPSTDGRMCEVQPTHERGLILVSAPSGVCTAAQEQRARQLETALTSPAWVRTIGVVPYSARSEPSRLLRDCQTVLVDEHFALWQITGADRTSASVCVIAADGHLQSRWLISADGSTANEAPVATTAERSAGFYARGNRPTNQ